MTSGTKIRIDSERRAWLTSAARRVYWLVCKNPSVNMLEYYKYARYVNVNQRINNRSWLASNHDGPMKLSLRYNRRNMHKDRPYIERSKYGQSKWNGFDFL